MEAARFSKSWYLITTLHSVTTQKSWTWIDANVVMLGTVTPAPAHVGLNLGSKDEFACDMCMRKCLNPGFG